MLRNKDKNESFFLLYSCTTVRNMRWLYHCNTAVYPGEPWILRCSGCLSSCIGDLCKHFSISLGTLGRHHLEFPKILPFVGIFQLSIYLLTMFHTIACKSDWYSYSGGISKSDFFYIYLYTGFRAHG